MEILGQLKCSDWGKVGRKSPAGVFYWHSRKRYLLNEEQTYSTVSFSAIPTGDTILKNNREPLYLFIEQQPQALGKKCGQQFKNKLPFIIKILSIQKSMPMGCHPNKVQAERLHSLYPERYLDTDHNPKVVIAIQHLEVLAGFRKKEEIFSFLSDVPELAIPIPYEKIEDYLYSGREYHLKEIIFYLMNATPSETKLSLDIFFKRVSNLENVTKSALYYSVLEKLQADKPYDCGVYAPFFFNHIVLNPGQALYIPSGVPYAYMAGDCLEVSTHSNNFIRCGLTTKFKDSHEFLNAADFAPWPVEVLLLEPTMVDVFLTAYTPPIQEFGVYRICIPEGHTYTLPVQESCSIILITRGMAVLEDFREIKLGTSLFILPFQKITFTVKKDITIYDVFPNLSVTIGEFGTLF